MVRYNKIYSRIGPTLMLNHVLPNASTELRNVFETFLPQLLIYPNPSDPLNGEAAALLMHNPEAYKVRVAGTQSRQLWSRIGSFG